MEVLHLSTKEFNDVVNQNETVVVDFWASWCGPCRMFSPILEEFASKTSNVVVAKVNVDEEPDLAARFGVSSIPTVLVFKGGKAVKKSVGVISVSDLEELVR